MKAAIISQGSKSSVMLGEALKTYFEEVDLIDLKKVEVVLGKTGKILYNGEELNYYDCVYVKGSFRFANLLASISSLLENKVPYLPLPAQAFTTVHNKLLTHLVLQQHKIPMPETYVSPNTEEAKLLLKKVRYPIVMKLPEGTQGKGVMFADSFSSASSMLDALGVLNQPFIIQEYIDTGGTDIRAIVVGDKVIAAMQRKAQKEEKRANIHAGGEGEPIQLSPEVQKLAVKTAKCLEVDICGVDILEGARGAMVIEANISPGLQGISEAVKEINIPDEIAHFFFEKTKLALEMKKKREATEVLKEIALDHGDLERPQQVTAPISIKNERIILPNFVTKLSEFEDNEDYVFKVKKGKVEIEKVKNLI